MTASESVHGVLCAVNSGELTARQAIDRLLGEAANEQIDLSSEPLGSLIARLGSPPGDLRNLWCRQFAALLEHQIDRDGGPPSSQVKLSQFAVSKSGSLVWNGTPYDLLDRECCEPRSEEVAAVVDQFRSRLCPRPRPSSTSRVDVRPSHPVAKMNARSLVTFDPSESTDPATPSKRPVLQALVKEVPKRQRKRPVSRDAKRRPPGFGRRIWLAIASVAIGLLVLLAAYQRFASRSNELSFVSNNDAPLYSDSLPLHESSETHPDSNLELQTVEDLLRERPPIEATDRGEPVSLLESVSSLDTPRFDRVNDGLKDEPAPPSPVAIDEVSTKDIASETEESLLDLDDRGVVNEDERFVDLTLSNEFIDALPISDAALSELALSFPCETTLELRANGEGHDVWDTRDQAVLARIEEQDQRMMLTWSDVATKRHAASVLAFGRLEHAGGPPIYLRRSPLVIDPLDFDFDQADVTIDWDLGGPVPPRSTRISVSIDLPDQFELQWSEQLETASPRQTKGIAVLRYAEHPQLELAVRFDVKCRSELSCRFRYAIRDGSQSSWQAVSREVIGRLEEQLRQREEWGDREGERLERVHAMADSVGRRVIRRKQDLHRRLGETLQQQSKNLSDIDAVFAVLEAEASIRFRVWVEWPDYRQEILAPSQGRQPTAPVEVDPSPRS